MLQRIEDIDRDPAETDDVIASTEDNENGSTGSTDWESKDNPYKKRFSGEQSRSARLESDLEAARSNLSNLGEIRTRLDEFEEILAEISDKSDSPAGRSELDSYDDELDNESTVSTTGRRTEKLQESRKARAERERNAQATQVYEIMQRSWSEGMDAQSPEMTEVTRLYNGALEDPAKRGDLNTALTLFNSYAKNFQPAATPSPGKSTAQAESTPDKGDVVADGHANDNSSNDNDSAPTARQKNAAANVGQGQEGSGGAAPRDHSSMTPLQKFSAHHDGQSPDTV
jgi:hypothetical protein